MSEKRGSPDELGHKLTRRDDWPQIRARIQELLEGGTPLRKVPYKIVEEFGVNRWSVMTAINRGLAPRAPKSSRQQAPVPPTRTVARRAIAEPGSLGPDPNRKVFLGAKCGNCGERLRYMDTGDCVICPAPQT